MHTKRIAKMNVIQAFYLDAILAKKDSVVELTGGDDADVVMGIKMSEM